MAVPFTTYARSRRRLDLSPLPNVMRSQTGKWIGCKKKRGSQNRKRSSGASDELFIQCRERAADAAHFGCGYSRILLCGAAGVVVFQPRSLWSALVLSLNADRPTSISAPPNSTRFFNSTCDVALQAANATHGKRRMRERQHDKSVHPICGRFVRQKPNRHAG
jgi:hypothetical protein